jgi:hypothetical protein
MIPAHARSLSMSASRKPQRKDPTHRPTLPIAPPQKRDDPARHPDEPDLRIEEIEDKHVPKDRNIFDK